MDFKLRKEHEMLRKAVRDYARKELAPTASERDAEERFDRGIQFDRLAELELPGIIFPANSRPCSLSWRIWPPR